MMIIIIIVVSGSNTWPMPFLPLPNTHTPTQNCAHTGTLMFYHRIMSIFGKHKTLKRCETFKREYNFPSFSILPRESQERLESGNNFSVVFYRLFFLRLEAILWINPINNAFVAISNEICWSSYLNKVILNLKEVTGHRLPLKKIGIC